MGPPYGGLPKALPDIVHADISSPTTRFKALACVQSYAVDSKSTHLLKNQHKLKLLEPTAFALLCLRRGISGLHFGVCPHFALQDYIALVDMTGRAIRDDKRGHIDNNFPPILQRLKIDTETWLHIATTFEDSFGPWIGSTEQIQQACENTGRHWVHRTVGCQKLYPT